MGQCGFKRVFIEFEGVTPLTIEGPIQALAAGIASHDPILPPIGSITINPGGFYSGHAAGEPAVVVLTGDYLG
jgi:hypothetical protein